MNQSHPITSSYEAKPGDVSKIVLLYSGGLDTSVMIRWLQENYHADVITVTANIGQPSSDSDFVAIKDKALRLGAKKAFVIDARDEFAKTYISPSIRANGLYQGYPMATCLGRPLLAKLAVDIADQEGADAIAHGCTGKGNDQVRIEASALTLKPDIKIVAPVRLWSLSREEEIAYANTHNIPVPHTVASPYSVDENMWGKSTECGDIEKPWLPVPKNAKQYVTPPEDAPDTASEITLTFHRGIPVALNGVSLSLTDLIMQLNEQGAHHGVGIVDMIEDRIVGIKIRDYYEAPAARIILTAHQDLERYVSTIHQNQFKPILDAKWSYMVYAGLWFDPLMEDLNAYHETVNARVSGEVTMKLYKGTCTVQSRTSPNGIFNANLASFGKEGALFNQQASPGFIELWSLQSRMAHQLHHTAHISVTTHHEHVMEKTGRTS